MRVTEATTIADLDEAMTHIAADLSQAQRVGNECRILVLTTALNQLLDRRNEMTAAT